MDIKDVTEIIKLLDLLRPPPNPWIPVFAAGVGAAGALVGGILPKLFLDGLERRREARALREALLSEIGAIVCLIHLRGYLADAREALSHLSNDSQLKRHYAIRTQERLAPIYSESSSRIGCLPAALVSKVVRFHALLEALKLDVIPGGVLHDGAGVKAFQEAVALLEQAMHLGIEVASEHVPKDVRLAYVPGSGT